MEKRKGKFFPFGIRVSGKKSLSKDFPITPIPEPKELKINLSQHIGAPAVPIVNVGDKVKKGQLIAKENGFVSANVYSGIAGTVTAIENLPTVTGALSTHIVIENDFSNEQVSLAPMQEFTAKSILDRIREAGIVGLGGAGFPTAVKLAPKDKVDTLIINAAECEPYLTCDYRLMVERTDDVMAGIRYIQKVLGVEKVIVAIEANKPDCIRTFEKFDDIDIVVLKKQYPMGSEKHLIYCCTGRIVECGALPASVGCVVQNVKTAIAVYEAVIMNKPLYEGIITVSGEGINQPKNIKAPFGTHVKEIIDFCGGLKENTQKLIAGGPMMGKAMITTDLYTKKTDSGILALTDKQVSKSMPSNCISCGICIKNCPMRLMPTAIESCVLSGDFKDAERIGVMNCIECGTCAFNCPAKRSLSQSFTMAKVKIRELQQQEKGGK